MWDIRTKKGPRLARAFFIGTRYRRRISPVVKEYSAFMHRIHLRDLGIQPVAEGADMGPILLPRATQEAEGGIAGQRQRKGRDQPACRQMVMADRPATDDDPDLPPPEAGL